MRSSEHLPFCRPPCSQNTCRVKACKRPRRREMGEFGTRDAEERMQSADVGRSQIGIAPQLVEVGPSVGRHRYSRIKTRKTTKTPHQHQHSKQNTTASGQWAGCVNHGLVMGWRGAGHGLVPGRDLGVSAWRLGLRARIPQAPTQPDSNNISTNTQQITNNKQISRESQNTKQTTSNVCTTKCKKTQQHINT